MGRVQNDFSQGKISRNIISMAVPMTVAQLVNVLYNVIDRIYLGRLPGCGHLAITGLGVTMPVISVILGLANLCGSGGAPLCSICRGNGNIEEAERVMGNSFTLLLGFGLLSTTGFLAVLEPMLYLFGASADTIGFARDYMSIYLCGTLFVMISLGMNYFINAQGFGNVGMVTVVIGAVLNLILDPILIFRLDMGVRGAALATVVSQGVSALWVLRFLMGSRAVMRLRWKYMRPQLRRSLRIVSLGLSGFFANLTNSVVQVVCNATLQGYGGDLYVGVMTILNSVREVFYMPIHGLTSASQPVTGFNYGARLYGRVCQSIRFSVLGTVAISAGVWGITMTVPGLLIRVFNDGTDVLQAGIPAMRIYFSMFLFMGLQVAGQSTYVGLGKAKHSVFFSLFRKVVINAPLTVILPIWMGTDGVFVAEAVSQLVGGLASFITMYVTIYRPMGRIRDGEPLPEKKPEHVI